MKGKTELIGIADAAEMAAAIEHLIALANVGFACIREEGAAERLRAIPNCISDDGTLQRAILTVGPLLKALKRG